MTVVVAVVMAFLLLPIVALFTYQPVGELIHGFGTKVATDAILVSLKTNADRVRADDRVRDPVRLHRSAGRGSAVAASWSRSSSCRW